MIFKPTDLLWVKNVKRENGTGWAYYEENTDQRFNLNFSRTQTKQANLVKPGEIILLFQKVDKIPGIAPRTYLTHLVTPVDYSKAVENPFLQHDYRWEREVAVVAKASLDDMIFTHAKNLSFFKPNWGKVCSISLLSETKSIEEIQNEVWGLFEGQFNADIFAAIDVAQEKKYSSDFDHGKLEGKEREAFRRHIWRERSPAIINLCKTRAIENGNLHCECCDFDFKKIYGSIGTNFIECHHRVPIATGGERKTYLEDLALVCSNCHRMLHRMKDDKSYYTTDSLKKIILSNLDR
ncbi:HNH endonuclease [Pedobacter namyangjuensis]|uniref:HNH endonuclease n=1 Tax=Pedobacter namyangjuensis TaxID=600626 RepID=UPI000DE1D58A|nr:HNH endonuclease [Pedobacter namyangjuensis]